MDKSNYWLILGLISMLQLSCMCTIVQAQSTTVSGVVTAAGTGETLPGVNITIKGTTIGTSTNMDGGYELDTPSLSDTLLFSFIGFRTREIPINGRTEIDVALQPQALVGEEIVVVGYSQKSRGEITGSVADISGVEIAETSANNITQAIQGKMPGVIVNSRGGGPGNNNANILIRGQSTLGNNAPLIVIDGVPRSKNDFAHLSPNAIESISVLKDASAAIYGARAANGVILITTKKGRIGRPLIQLTSGYGVQTVTKYPDAMNAYQRAKYWNEFYQYDGLQPLYTQEELEHFRSGDQPLAYPNTDWVDVVLSDFAPKTHHNLSASGGTENIRYYLSGDYLFEGGLYEANSLQYNQFQIRANVTSQVTDNLTVGVNLLGRQGKRHSSLGWEGVWQGILNNYPWLTARWSDGRLGPGLDTGNSALTDSDDEYGWINSNRYTFNSKLSFEYDLPWITENLQLSGYASFDYMRLNNDQFQDIWTAYSYNSTTDTFSPVQGHTFGTPYSRVLTIEHTFASTRFYQLQLNYKKAFGDHAISAFAAYEQSESSVDILSAYRRGLPSDKKVQLFAGSEIGKDNYGTASVDGRVNYFGSISYNYAGKYMLDFSLRYDGSFNFPKDSRFGLFPAVSVGWNISNESFLNSTNDWLDHLRLRLSWGKMGNDRIPAYQYLTRYQLGGTGNYYAFGTDPQAQKALVALNLANPNITWEKSYKSNVGVDLRGWNGLLGLTVDYFHEKRRDILTSRSASVPTYTAISLPDENIGKVDSRGIELSLHHENTVGSVFYQLRGNMTYYNNEIIFMDEAGNIPDYQRQEGHPIQSWLVYKADGLFRSQEEIDSYPHLSGTQPGDIKYVDVDSDGQITGNDMIRKYTSPIPKIMFGFSAGVHYKNFALDVFFQGQAKAEQMVFDTDSGIHVIQAFYQRRWTPENRDASLPRAFSRDDVINVRPSTFWLSDASFLRLKNVQIAYTLPSEWLSKIGISNLSVYVNGRNLMTWDRMLGNWDPERPEGYYYPQITTFTLGTDIRF